MADLYADTNIEGADGEYVARVSKEWAAFGPSGGYLAALALRAAGMTTHFVRPASFSCHYLGPADFSTVRIQVQRLVSGRRAELLRVSMTQQGRPILEAMVWAVGEIEGFPDHEALLMPESPDPDSLVRYEEVPHPFAPRAPLHLWRNIDQRLIGWQGWDQPGEPKLESWYRFHPRAVMPEPFLDAARSVFIVDVSTWLAAMNPHVTRARVIAPTIDLSVRFYHPAKTEWLRCSARSDAAVGGLIDGYAAVWSRDGRLVASGGSQMMYRTSAPLPSGAAE